MSGKAAARGLFVGLCTLDVVSSVQRLPGPDEKVTALAQTISAGGPAANAAVAFAHLVTVTRDDRARSGSAPASGQASLLTGVGAHPLGVVIRVDLERAGVRLIDMSADDPAPPAVSSIMVTAGSGERAIVSPNAAGRLLGPPAGLDDLVGEHDVVLADGHHPLLARAALAAARRVGSATVLDGGSWKPGTAELLADVDVAVCSADFRPPGTRSTAEVLTFLLAAGVTWAAVTRGAEPIVWAGRDGRSGTVPVPAVGVVDTLGAGDVFHGALAHALAVRRARASGADGTAGRTGPVPGADPAAFPDDLDRAARHAAASCAFFGTRAWMDASGPRRP